MAAIDDHPLRLARIRAGLTAEALAELVGVSRGTVNALEQGRIRTPRPLLVARLAELNNMKPERLQAFYDAWLQDFESSNKAALSRIQDQLTPKARGTLALDPALIPRYGSFTAWRRDIMPSVAGFASLLLLSTTTVRRFEAGGMPMPKPLIRALSKNLQLSDEYVQALMSLEGTDPDDAVRAHWRDRKIVQRQRGKWKKEGDPRGDRTHTDPKTFIAAPAPGGLVILDTIAGALPSVQISDRDPEGLGPNDD